LNAASTRGYGSRDDEPGTTLQQKLDDGIASFLSQNGRDGVGWCVVARKMMVFDKQ